MTCFHPIKAIRRHDKINSDTGKPLIDFNVQKGYEYKRLPECWELIEVPCGRCIGCRLEHSRQWAVRCVHEASLWESNCFITLTFNDDNLASDGSLHKEDFVKFMKRLRKRFGEGIRFFHCGEYGSKLGRPHHHAIIFNFDFPDKVLWSARYGVRLYVSDELQRLWPFGFSTIGSVTFESCAYVARYIMKKIRGKDADAYYKGKVPEYLTMSRRPGIARGWLDKYMTDVYPHDYVVLRDGIKCRPPKYYDRIFESTNPDMLKDIKERRKLYAEEHRFDSEPERLSVREKVQQLKLEKLIRPIEE